MRWLHTANGRRAPARHRALLTSITGRVAGVAGGQCWRGSYIIGPGVCWYNGSPLQLLSFLCGRRQPEEKLFHSFSSSTLLPLLHFYLLHFPLHPSNRCRPLKKTVSRLKCDFCLTCRLHCASGSLFCGLQTTRLERDSVNIIRLWLLALNRPKLNNSPHSVTHYS